MGFETIEIILFRLIIDLNYPDLGEIHARSRNMACTKNKLVTILAKRCTRSWPLVFVFIYLFYLLFIFLMHLCFYSLLLGILGLRFNRES